MIRLSERWGNFQVGILALHLAAVTSLIVLPWQYWLISVVAYLVINPSLQFIVHEYVSHRIVEPKTTWYKIMVLLVYHAYSGSMSSKRSFHIAHHRHWLDSNLDPTQKKIRANNFWSYVFGLGRPVDFDFRLEQHPLLTPGSIESFMQQHSLAIKIATLVASLLVMPWPMVCVIFIIVPWMMTLVYNYHDWRFHGPEPRRDINRWFLFFANQTWHVQHHKNPNLLYFGPGAFRYFNLSWYLYKLCFRPI